MTKHNVDKYRNEKNSIGRVPREEQQRHVPHAPLFGVQYVYGRFLVKLIFA